MARVGFGHLTMLYHESQMGRQLSPKTAPRQRHMELRHLRGLLATRRINDKAPRRARLALRVPEDLNRRHTQCRGRLRMVGWACNMGTYTRTLGIVENTADGMASLCSAGSRAKSQRLAPSRIVGHNPNQDEER